MYLFILNFFQWLISFEVLLALVRQLEITMLRVKASILSDTKNTWYGLPQESRLVWTTEKKHDRSQKEVCSASESSSHTFKLLETLNSNK